MSDPLIGEIKLFAGNFPPRGWAFCEGQLLAISSNQALFSILGTTYGGDGRTTFGLPDCRGRCAIQQGSGPGLTARTLGQKSGTETVTLTQAQMPQHSHTVSCQSADGDGKSPVDKFPSASRANDAEYHSSGNASMNANMIARAGQGAAHDNMPPFIGLNYIIALIGIFPSRN